MPPPAYRVREASLDDVGVLVHHRVAMFSDMGVPMDIGALQQSFAAWLEQMMPAGTYRAWLAVDAGGVVVAGGGISILPWPPGPHYLGDRLAVVYNVYTEPEHRSRGLGRLIMDTIHAWCRDAGISSMALNASRDGRPLYESMGYVESPNPLMFLPIVRV